LGLDDVVKAELPDGHHDGTRGSPIGTTEQLEEPFLTADLGPSNSVFPIVNFKEKVASLWSKTIREAIFHLIYKSESFH